jgi:uncharacterized protein (DUF1810 family)
VTGPVPPGWEKRVASPGVGQMPTGDPYKLQRFVDAQRDVYGQALGELRAGRKRSHWMWFVFPQVEGLGESPTSRYYAIRGLDEARAYLEHPVLGPRLLECARALVALAGNSARDIFGFPDDVKLRSSMTLFELADPGQPAFAAVIDQYFDSQRDGRTVDLIKTRG